MQRGDREAKRGDEGCNGEEAEGSWDLYEELIEVATPIAESACLPISDFNKRNLCVALLVAMLTYGDSVKDQVSSAFSSWFSRDEIEAIKRGLLKHMLRWKR